MPTTDVYNVNIDAATVALVDAYAAKSAFRPSRRQAVRALIRIGLRQVGIPRISATAPVAAPAAGEQQVAS
jgi:hypothetical protein